MIEVSKLVTPTKLGSVTLVLDLNWDLNSRRASYDEEKNALEHTCMLFWCELVFHVVNSENKVQCNSVTNLISAFGPRV
jgi:hypothetical protein